jgi:hypothetical protein
MSCFADRLHRLVADARDRSSLHPLLGVRTAIGLVRFVLRLLRGAGPAHPDGMTGKDAADGE